MPRRQGAKDSNYHEKRVALLERMTVRMMRRETARPSLRHLADAAGVTVSTLRHYFGGRTEVVRAIMEEYLARGRQRLEVVATPKTGLEASVRDYASSLLHALAEPRAVRLGDVFAVSLSEGLLDSALGPSALTSILDPSVDALRRRLDAHVALGEMQPCNTRAAALLLLTPLLLAALHQDQMGGRACNPLDLPLLADEICGAFLRAYGQ